MTFTTRFQYLYDKALDIAQTRAHLNPAVKPLPPLFFFTDPARILHPEDIAEHLPAGCGLVYRHFGEGHALQRARLLQRIARQRELVLLIGEDEALAHEVAADGVHLAERSLDNAMGMASRHPDFILTAACHNLQTLKHRAIDHLDGIFVSPVFTSRSASADGAVALGVKGAQIYANESSIPVYGLGGINCDTIAQLRGSGLSGVAAVDAFSLRD